MGCVSGYAARFCASVLRGELEASAMARPITTNSRLPRAKGSRKSGLHVSSAVHPRPKRIARLWDFGLFCLFGETPSASADRGQSQWGQSQWGQSQLTLTPLTLTPSSWRRLAVAVTPRCTGELVWRDDAFGCS